MSVRMYSNFHQDPQILRQSAHSYTFWVDFQSESSPLQLLLHGHSQRHLLQRYKLTLVLPLSAEDSDDFK